MEVFYWCPVTNQNVNRISGSIGLDKVLFATNSARKYFSCISLNKAKKISVRMTIITAAWPIASYGTSSWSSSAARNRYPDSVLRISTFDFKYDQDRFTFVCIAAPFRSVSFWAVELLAKESAPSVERASFQWLTVYGGSRIRSRFFVVQIFVFLASPYRPCNFVVVTFWLYERSLRKIQL